MLADGMIYYFLVAFGVFACSASQILLKKSANIEHHSPIYELLNWRVIVAYGIMFLTLVANIYAMSHGVLLKDMPILESLGYIFVPVLSMLFLSEKIRKNNIVAIVLIIIGIFVFYV